MPQNKINRVLDQNVYGPESSVDHVYKGGYLRPVAMPLGRNQIVLSPSRHIDGNLPRDNNFNNIRGEVNNQNLYGYQPTRDIINLIGGGTGSYQSLAVNEQVVNPSGVGVDLNYQGVQGGFNSPHKTSQFAPRSRSESNSIDFSQSLTQILSSLGHNLNAHPKEGFSIVFACTDMWKETMTTRHSNQEERILSLEHHLLVMTNTIQGSQTSFLGLQAEFGRLDEMVTRHEIVVSG